MERKKIEHSEPVQEIMGTIPSWITRWGIFVIFSVFVLLFLGCCFIRYPQTLSAEIIITSSNPPSRIASRHSGLLDSIAVENGQQVSRGDLLALFSAPAKYNDILAIQSFLDQAVLSPIDSILSLSCLNKSFRLGNLQPTWAEILAIAEEYTKFKNVDLNGHKIESLQEQIKHGNAYIDALLRQSESLNKDLKVQQNLFVKDSLLFQQKMISEYEFELSLQSYLAKQANMTGFEATLRLAENNLLQLEQASKEYEYQKIDATSQYNLRMYDALRRMHAEIDLWMETYAIISQVEGRVSLQDFWSKGQHADIGDIIATVVPSMQDSIQGRMRVPSAGFGKLKEGQEVKIQVNGFPYMEYGILKGRVSKISQAPEKASSGEICYLVEVIFPKGLISTYGKTFPMIQEMNGNALILTEDMKLIDYLLKPIKSIIHNDL